MIDAGRMGLRPRTLATGEGRALFAAVTTIRADESECPDVVSVCAPNAVSRCTNAAADALLRPAADAQYPSDPVLPLPPAPTAWESPPSVPVCLSTPSSPPATAAALTPERVDPDVHSPWELPQGPPCPLPPAPSTKDEACAVEDVPHHHWSLAGLLALSMVSGVSARAVAAEAPPPDNSATTQNVSHPSTQKDMVPLPEPTPISTARVDYVELNARIERTAQKAGLNPDLLKAVAWQESSWIHVRANGALVTQANRDPVSGEVLSVDSGIMQINDRAHPDAFPAARTLDGNLSFGARLLGDIVTRYGADGVWHYNGSPDYLKAIRTHMAIRPWSAEIMRDHVRALNTEKQALEQDVSRETKSVDDLQKQADATQLKLREWERGIELAATPAAHENAERNRDYARAQLSKAQDRLTQAQTVLVSDRDRLQSLSAEIQIASARSAAESARVRAAESAAYVVLKGEVLAATQAQVEKLEDQQREADALLVRLKAVSQQGGLKASDVKTLTRQAQGLRTRAILGLKTLRPLLTSLQGADRPALPPIQKSLRVARSRARTDDAVRGRLDQILSAHDAHLAHADATPAAPLSTDSAGARPSREEGSSAPAGPL